MGANPFYSSDNLSEIRVVGEGGNIRMVDSVLFDREMTRIIWCSPVKSGRYEIPQTVRTIDTGVFSRPRKLRAIILPDSFTDLSRSDFSGKYCVKYSEDSMLRRLSYECSVL